MWVDNGFELKTGSAEMIKKPIDNIQKSPEWTAGFDADLRKKPVFERANNVPHSQAITGMVDKIAYSRNPTEANQATRELATYFRNNPSLFVPNIQLSPQVANKLHMPTATSSAGIKQRFWIS